MILKKPLPPEIADDLTAYVGCISGAISAEEYRDGLLEAGFAEVAIVDTGADLNAYAQVESQGGCCSAPSPLPIESAPRGGCCGSAAPSSAGSSQVHTGLHRLIAKYDINEYAASAKVFAVKPK